MLRIRAWKPDWLVFLGIILAFSGAGERSIRANSQGDDLPSAFQPQAGQAIQSDLSLPLDELVELLPELVNAGSVEPEAESLALPLGRLPKASLAEATPFRPDPVLQGFPELFTGAQMPGTSLNFEGIHNRNGVLPPDTNGDIGPNHYVQWVNLSFAVWAINRENGAATLVLGPVSGNSLWAGFGGPCETRNDGDPIVLYDHLADRWLMSQFAVNGPYYQCIAVSQTGDPTGAWFRYAFLVSHTKMNDYPHFGIWPDAFYMTANQFESRNWAAAGVWAFEREMMLAGDPAARFVFFDLQAANNAFGGMLPSDLDGPPPPPSTPAYFIEVDDSSWLGSQDALRLWEFRVNWSNPAASSFGLSGQPNQVLPVAAFTPLCSYTTKCIPQPATTAALDALGDRLMHRVQYRNFGSYASLLASHTVDAGGSRAGVRWYELRNPGSGWTIRQQGTYAGDGLNPEHRWMGSLAMDKRGNIALGYSVSSPGVFPSIRYNGRLEGDPLGTMPQGENTLIAGAGAQLHSSSRWGDYSMLSVDPTDGCTFWFTSEYYSITSSSGWRTRVGSFRFPNCTPGLDGELRGKIESNAGNPLAGVVVNAGSFSAMTGDDGWYLFPALPPGEYTVAARLYGYQPVSYSGVLITQNLVTTRDFTLVKIPTVQVSGMVKDGSGQGWPLYSRVEISSPGFSHILYTDPRDGSYQVELAQGVEHSFTASAVSAGYNEKVLPVTPLSGGPPVNFELLVNPSCSAPGYSFSGSCNAQTGGLIVGNVYDANTGLPVLGATISGDGSPVDLGTSFATPDDDNQANGFFILFSSQTGNRSISASAEKYGEDLQQVQVDAYQVAWQDFHLPAGQLSVTPNNLVIQGASVITEVLSIRNTGTLAASFTLSLIKPIPHASGLPGQFASPTRHVSPKRLDERNASFVFEDRPPPAALLPAGTLLETWASGLQKAWGIAYDQQLGRLWVTGVRAEDEVERLHEYLPSGAATGGSIAIASQVTVFPAGLAYDPQSGNLWQVNVGGDNCIFEVDPLGMLATGEKICPPFSNSQRGLAFDPLTSTFFSGSWNDGILYHFDVEGILLDSHDTGLLISGLAYNPSAGRLLVLTNSTTATSLDVYVLDVYAGYAVVGGFNVPSLDDYEQAGLALDCAGNLWAINQVDGRLILASSGEEGVCAWAEVPWLDLSPQSGDLAASESLSVWMTANPEGLAAGKHEARLIVDSPDIPYGAISVLITLEVPFAELQFFPLLWR